jgi:uncharacterized protein YbjT (DUF2867 family)
MSVELMGTLRVAVIGASGLMGSALAARLASEGHEVIGVSRHPPRVGLPGITHLSFDLAQATHPESWLTLLRGIDAVVNCAGTLQDGPGDSTEAVHFTGIKSLFAACERLHIRRVVHLSAINVERKASAFSATKFAGDADLMARDLDWVVLKPSVVMGHAAYGGSALMRGLAALPFLPVMPETGLLQPVWLCDVVETIVFCLTPLAPSRVVLELVGPSSGSFIEWVRLFRRWFGWPAVPAIKLPMWIAAMLYKMGDAAGFLGWRPPVRTTARREMIQGATGDGRQWREVTGIHPTEVEAALARQPASVQERWFARLYLLKPLVLGVFGLYWIATGLVSFGPGWDIGTGLMREGGVHDPLASLVVILGASADICIGLAIICRATSRYGLYAALTISVAYAVIGTILVPRLWADPLGSMLKIWPVMVLNLVALAIREDR